MRITEEQYLYAINTIKLYRTQVEVEVNDLIDEHTKIKIVDGIGFLSVRTLNNLKCMGVENLYQLKHWTVYKLIRQRGIGRKAINEIQDYLESKNLELKKR